MGSQKKWFQHLARCCSWVALPFCKHESCFFSIHSPLNLVLLKSALPSPIYQRKDSAASIRPEFYRFWSGLSLLLENAYLSGQTNAASNWSVRLSYAWLKEWPLLQSSCWAHASFRSGCSICSFDRWLRRGRIVFQTVWWSWSALSPLCCSRGRKWFMSRDLSQKEYL